MSRAQSLIQQYEAARDPRDQVSDVCYKYITKLLKRLLADYPDKMSRWLGKPTFTFSTTSEFDGFENNLRFSIIGLDSEAIDDADKAIDAATGEGFAVGSGLRALVTHEFGHAVDNFIRFHADDDLKDEWFDAKKAFFATAAHPSKYSHQNSREHFAEMFAQEVLEKRGSGPLHVLIFDFIEKLEAAKLI